MALSSKILKLVITFNTMIKAGGVTGVVNFQSPDDAPVCEINMDTDTWERLGEPTYMRVTFQPCNVNGFVDEQ